MIKLLIIEDDEPTRKLTAEVLRFEGFEVFEASNGRLGIAAALACLPDLVICDVMMPDVDGFEVLQALREDPKTALTPFIFVTAMVASQDLRHGMDEGADDYITKPYNPDVLLGSVRRRLEKRSRQEAESGRRAEQVSLAVAASVPQEIMETLGHINTVTNLLAMKYAGQDPEVAAVHDAILQESLRLERISRRLHIFSQLPQLYTSRFTLEKTDAASKSAPAGTVERVTQDVCRRWKRDGDLDVTPTESAAPLSADYLSLFVEELVDNACKFSAPGSPIKVHAEFVREFWSLAVISSGAGMSSHQISQIGAFKQFWNGTVKPRGLGLGLALTQGIARLHSGEFALESGNGRTTATVLIPLDV